MSWNQFVLTIFSVIIVLFIGFFIWCAKAPKLHLLHKLYLILGICYMEWIAPLMLMRFIDDSNVTALFILDCFTSIGGLLASCLYFLIAVSFVKGYNRAPKWFWLTMVVPVISMVVTFTNPWHHLQYVEFSIYREDIVFGPFILVSGGYSYFCLMAAVVILVLFGLRNNNVLYLKQCLLVATGGIVPLIVNAIATFSDGLLPITATPMAFIITIITNGIAIYQLHLLDMKPVAVQQVMDGISDGYMIVSESGLIIAYNRSFEKTLGVSYGMQKNQYLKDCVKKEDIVEKTAVFNMLAAIESCQQQEAAVTYEQNLSIIEGENVTRKYYVTTVSPVILHGENSGFVLVFRDVTQLKESMQQLQKSRERMIEQESLAFLGQMIGGIAHNLKTPIMGISGCLSSAEALIEECEESIGDPEVTEEDYMEIFGEIRGWFSKIRESTSYMSDIITAIKGQATNVAISEDSIFDIEEALRRCRLLIRHEMQKAGCTLRVVRDTSRTVRIRGDVNNLVQVIVNLLSNAAYAQKETGGEIFLKVERRDDGLDIIVEDHGIGVSEQVKNKLFKSMVTNKGAMGTGIGLYISNTVIKGKFEGSMWHKDNPEGGAVFGISIPEKRIEDSEEESMIGGKSGEEVQD